MSHIFQRYFDKKGHFPRVEVLSGIQKITVEFCPGYISIASSSPYQAKVYVTRCAALQLLRKMIPLAKKWEAHPDFDVPEAMRQVYWDELALTQAKRDLKKLQSVDTELGVRADRQRRRFRAARARRLKRELEGE